MDLILNYIEWDVDPKLITIFGREIRYYGLLFALSFLLGVKMSEKVFAKEGIDMKKLDKLFIYIMLSTVVGARLGHCFFYDFEAYMEEPITILYIWEGGLASHGATIGIFIGLLIYERKIMPGKLMWILDRVTLPIALSCFLIRLGNLFNHEILGEQTEVPWAFIFKRSYEEMVPRHPAQLYESLCYLIVFIMLYKGYWNWGWAKQKGKLFGILMLGIFSVRFLIEFVKLKQTDAEAEMLGNIGLNMGHVLSIPAILIGIYFIIKSNKNEAVSA